MRHAGLLKNAPHFQLSVDVVIPTVRANAAGLRHAVGLSVPDAFAGLRFLIVVDGPQPEEAWSELAQLEAPHVVLLSTQPGHHGWPAGASAARNVGIDRSDADWVLFLDDDTMPQPDLLHRYAEAAEEWLHGTSDDPAVYGFAGATSFVAPPDSLWAVAARCNGMIDGFTNCWRAVHPSWSPTANLMLRRTMDDDVSHCSDEDAEAAAEAIDVASEDAALLSPQLAHQGPRPPSPPASCACGGGNSSSDVAQPQLPPSPSMPGGQGCWAAGQRRAGRRRRRLPWCRFDESLPANGGAEDIDICLRASVWPRAGMPVEHVDDGDGGRYPRPAATQRLVGVPAAVTTHTLWSARGMVMRALRWGYAGGLIAHKHAPLTHSRPFSTVECAVRAGLLSAAGAAVASPLCRPWRAALLVVSLLLADQSFNQVMRMRRRVATARHLPEHMRVSPDEPAIVARCGGGGCGGGSAGALLVRWATLAALFAGPMLWLSLGFQLGELASKLSAPLTEPRRLWLIGRSLDVSFGADEMPPRSLMRRISCSLCFRDAVHVAVAVCLELVLCGALSVSVSGGVVYGG